MPTTLLTRISSALRRHGGSARDKRELALIKALWAYADQYGERGVRVEGAPNGAVFLGVVYPEGDPAPPPFIPPE